MHVPFSSNCCIAHCLLAHHGAASGGQEVQSCACHGAKDLVTRREGGCTLAGFATLLPVLD